MHTLELGWGATCRAPTRRVVVVATTLLPPGDAPLFCVGSAEEEGGEYG